MDNYIGEIRLFSFGQAPKEWVACNGQTLPVNANAALFALLGVQYGGDGKATFGVPDLRGRVPVQVSNQIAQATASGSETVALTVSQLPTHNHPVAAYSTSGNTGALASGYPATCTAPSANPAPPAAPCVYGPATSLVAIAPASVANSGATSQTPLAHENRQPTMAMNYCIATTGIYPPRN